jgi:hypothetical protein
MTLQRWFSSTELTGLGSRRLRLAFWDSQAAARRKMAETSFRMQRSLVATNGVALVALELRTLKVRLRVFLHLMPF